MSRALIILNWDQDRIKAIEWIRKAPWGTRVEFKAAKRTLPMNSKMWALLTEVSQQVKWHGEHLLAEDWKSIFMVALKKARLVPGIDPGSFVPLGMRTSDLSKEEFSELISLIEAFGAQHGVTFKEQQAA